MYNPFNISNKFNTTTRGAKPRNSALEVRPGWCVAKKWTKECWGEECRGGWGLLRGPKGVGVKYGQGLQVGKWITEGRIGQRARERIPAKWRIMKCTIPLLSCQNKKVGVGLDRTVEKRGFWVWKKFMGLQGCIIRVSLVGF